MTEDQARQVLLLQAQETALSNPHWSLADRAWATRQALTTVGERASAEAFVTSRAALAMQRLLPRDASAQRWLKRRLWHPAWVAVALVLGLVLGLGVDQLGTPQRVNLLAPAVWAVVAWNLTVYLMLLLPGNTGNLRQWMAAWSLRSHAGAAGLWAQHALNLSIKRWAVVLHMMAAGLGLGLMAGLYLRGLVLDYRAGWESTFLDAPTVQAVLGTLLAPASGFTRVSIPDLAPLQLVPGAAAQASAAPWIHLYAATLALAVVVPRILLALWSAGRAHGLSQRFALPLDTPYFESLAPLMQPRLPRAVRLLWAAPESVVSAAGLRLFETAVPAPLSQPLTVLKSDEGDELVLHPAPLDALQASTEPRPAVPWWQPWRLLSDPVRQLFTQLQANTDVVLLLQGHGSEPPAWLAAVARPVVILHEGPDESAPHKVSLQAMGDGWLPQGRLLLALAQALPEDPRLRRLQLSWQWRQQTRFDQGVALLAAGLADIGSQRVPLDDNGLMSRRSDADAARGALADAVTQRWQDAVSKLAAWAAPNASSSTALVVAQAAAPGVAMHKRMGEGRAAMVGGVLTGALAGLKADLLTGGMTMGMGAVTGGVLGALGGAGVARGLNVVRGADSSYAALDDKALNDVTEALLQQYLGLVHGLHGDAALARLKPALAGSQLALNERWRARTRGAASADPTAVQALAVQLQPVLATVVHKALGGPTPGFSEVTIPPQPVLLPAPNAGNKSVNDTLTLGAPDNAPPPATPH